MKEKSCGAIVFNGDDVLIIEQFQGFFSFPKGHVEPGETDEMYRESWVCKMTHLGIFDVDKGIFNKIKFYDEIKNNKLVSFDTGYDFIAVPISEKEMIEKLLGKAKLMCTESKRNKPGALNKEKLRNRII